MLEIRAVNKTFNPGTPNELRALQAIDLTVNDGAFVVIIGTNGSGKSTLLNAVAGSFYVDSGSISLAGTDINKWPEHQRAELIGRVFQNPFSGTAASMSIAENLALAAYRGKPRRLGWPLRQYLLSQMRDRVSQLNMGLEDRLDHHAAGEEPLAHAPARRTPHPTAAPEYAPSSAGNSGADVDTKQTDQNQQTPMPGNEKPDKKHTPHKNFKTTPATGQGKQVVDVAQNSQTPPATSAQLEELEKQADQLSSQANSVNDSLDNLRRQQNAQGVGLRGDISSAQELMKTHLAKAQTALQNGDATGAKKYLDLAEGDVARIDKFLGR